MRTIRLRPAQVLLPLALCIAFGVMPRDAVWAQFSDVALEVNASAGNVQDSHKATGLPIALSADAHYSEGYEREGNHCSALASSTVQVVGNTSSIVASMRVDQDRSSSFGCVFAPLDPAKSSVRVTAITNEPVYKAFAIANSPPEETETPRTDRGVIDDSQGFGGFPWFGVHADAITVWSVGAPAGSATTPFVPLSVANGSQLFMEPTQGDAAQGDGLRYQQPVVDPSSMSLGFDLKDAKANPFTAFRFPDVPAGVDKPFFALELGGDTWISGLAGETVDLRQYAPAGFSALSLRGDLTPFLPAAAAPDAAIPIGGPPPQLTFGLAFAQPGIGSFTLKPVPEPSSVILIVLGLALILLAKCDVSVRTAIWRSARNSRPLATRRAF